MFQYVYTYMMSMIMIMKHHQWCPLSCDVLLPYSYSFNNIDS